MLLFFFFFNDTATTEIYTLSLHDALPICEPETASAAWTMTLTGDSCATSSWWAAIQLTTTGCSPYLVATSTRSEEHTSELQSQSNLVCRLLLEKKKNKVERVTLTPKTAHD